MIGHAMIRLRTHGHMSACTNRIPPTEPNAQRHASVHQRSYALSVISPAAATLASSTCLLYRPMPAGSKATGCLRI